MKKLVLAIIFTLAAATGVYAADVGVSVSVGQPGFYGRLDIGDFPRPQVVYAKPVVVRPAPVRVGEPVYLHVPPGQAKNWSRNCGKYNACDRPVYFVKERWYNKVYVPQYQARHGNYGHGNQGGPQGRH
ncbi:MAG: hypothetical protein ABFD62_15605 [Syntrophaceae bacterium]